MGFKEIHVKKRYRSNEHLFTRDFLAPVLNETKLYKRAVGYFSSTALIDLTVGLFSFAQRGGRILLVTSPRLSDEDIEAIQLGYKTREKAIEDALNRELVEPVDVFEEERLNLIATMIASGTMEVRLAFMSDDTAKNMYHEKIAVFTDRENNRIAYTGSINDSENAFFENFESVYVFSDWIDETNREFVDIAENDFDQLWDNRTSKVEVIPFPSAVLKKIDQYRKDSVDYETDEKQYELFKPQKDSVFHIPEGVKLREFQKEAVSDWKKNGHREIFAMCTGSGKSYTALACMVDLAEEVSDQLAVFIVCPQIHLVGQWEEDVINWGPEPIIAHSQSPNRHWKEDLVVAYKRFRNSGKPFICITTKDTFAGEYMSDIVARFTPDQNVLLIIDEAHIFGAKHLSSKLPENVSYRLALSATIERHGDRAGTDKLFGYFSDRCFTYDVEQAIKDGVLTKYRYYPIPVGLTEEEYEEYRRLTELIGKNISRDTKGKIIVSEIGKLLLFKRSRLMAGASRKKQLLKSIIEPYREKSHILVYCGSSIENDEETGTEVRQIDDITEMLGSELGMRSHRFTAEEDMVDRLNIKKFFEDGLYQVITAIKCLDEGVNIPSIRTAFIMASTRNPREFIQRRGRLLRNSPGKEYAEIYDFVTLPREIEDALPSDFETDKGVLIGEMSRIKEFGRLSENPAKAEAMINRLMSAYDCYIDIEKAAKEMEEEFNE